MRQPEKANPRKLRVSIVGDRFLTSMIRVLCAKKMLNRKSLNNIDEFLTMLDEDHYSKDKTVKVLLGTAKIALENRLTAVEGMNLNTVLTEIDVRFGDEHTDVKKNMVYPIFSAGFKDVTDREVDLVCTTCENYVKYYGILSVKDKIVNVTSKFDEGSVENLNEMIDNYRKTISTLNEEFRRTDNLLSSNVIHTLDEDEYLNILLESYKGLKNPKFSLLTGLKMFNQMLSENGGFLANSYYIFYASINSFKSALLQYISIWIRKYNSDNYLGVFEETSRIPTVLYYSFENTRKENVNREFTMLTGKNLKDVRNETDVKKMWDKANKEINSIIDITTVYAESNTVRVSDIRKQVRTLNDSGYYVIAVIIDYLELLRAEDEDLHLDNRLKLGYISNSLHVMAVSDDLTVITAQQMNRAAEATMSDLREKATTNIVRSLNRQYIGESYGIDKPTDFSAYIALERSIYDDKLYLTVKRDKCRYRRTDTEYFVHELQNGFYIEDDVNTDKVLSKSGIMPSKEEKELPQKIVEEIQSTIREAEKSEDGDENTRLIAKIFEYQVKNYVMSHYFGTDTVYNNFANFTTCLNMNDDPLGLQKMTFFNKPI